MCSVHKKKKNWIKIEYVLIELLWKSFFLLRSRTICNDMYSSAFASENKVPETVRKRFRPPSHAPSEIPERIFRGHVTSHPNLELPTCVACKLWACKLLLPSFVTTKDSFGNLRRSVIHISPTNVVDCLFSWISRRELLTCSYLVIAWLYASFSAIFIKVNCSVSNPNDDNNFHVLPNPLTKLNACNCIFFFFSCRCASLRPLSEWKCNAYWLVGPYSS